LLVRRHEGVQDLIECSQFFKIRWIRLGALKKSFEHSELSRREDCCRFRRDIVLLTAGRGGLTAAAASAEERQRKARNRNVQFRNHAGHDRSRRGFLQG
jgi:hypothetical protein